MRRAGVSPASPGVETAMNPPSAPGGKRSKRLDSKDCRTPRNLGVRPPKGRTSRRSLSIYCLSVPATLAPLRTAGQWTSYAMISHRTRGTSVMRLCAANDRRGTGSINASRKRCPAMLHVLRKNSAGGSNGRHHLRPAHGTTRRSLVGRCVTLYA